MNYFIQPNWPAPSKIRAYTTLQKEGLTLAPSLDTPERIHENRAWLKEILHLPNDPIWVKQKHGTTAISAQPENHQQEADAVFSKAPQQVCLVLTADCLPILLCNREGTHVAAIHGGWRGLAHGIIESTLQALDLRNEEIMAWIGPGISAKHYEVGSDVRDAFLKVHADAEFAFTATGDNHWQADLFALARLRLRKQGVTQIYGGEYCTYSHPEMFYSYRRDKGIKGHMATLIWIDN